MAVSKNFLEKINDITECPICCESFTDPRVLPCIHTFCLKCIEKYGEATQPGQDMPCPLCRVNFVVPSGGFSNFPRNSFLVKLIEAQKSQETPKKEDSKYCDVCLSTSEQKESEINCANKYCVECQGTMCDLCCKHHRGMKISKHHQIVQLQDRINHTQLKESSKVACEQHQSEEVKIYCACCKQVGCLKCFTELHQSHECYDVCWAAGEMITIIGTDLKQVKPFIVDVDEKFEQLNNTMQLYADMMTRIEQEILRRGEELKQLITNDVQKLLDELNAKKSQTLKIFETTKDELEMRKVQLESYRRFSNALIENGISADIARNADDLHVKAYDMCRQPIIEVKQSVELQFRRTDLKGNATWDMQENIVGRITNIYSLDWGTENLLKQKLLASQSTKYIPLRQSLKEKCESRECGIQM